MKYLFSLLFVLSLSAASSASAQYETHTFVWDPPVDTVVLSYHLFWREIAPLGNEHHMQVPANQHTATVTTLPAGKSYQVNVACIGLNSEGVAVYSERSNTLCFGPACSASGTPRAPTGVRIVGK